MKQAKAYKTGYQLELRIVSQQDGPLLERTTLSTGALKPATFERKGIDRYARLFHFYEGVGKTWSINSKSRHTGDFGIACEGLVGAADRA